jgi:hypothetical protein
MKANLTIFLSLCLASLNACVGTTTRTANFEAEGRAASGAKIESDSGAAAANIAVGKAAEKIEPNEVETAASQTKEPRAVRDFFNLLPQKYFTLEGCEPARDKNCERARRDYVKSYLEVEDAANGYWKSSCDGAQSCLRMALFKRPDNTYVVGVHTLHEADETNYFLEYKGGQWFDISAKIVPEFSERNIYELPRYGTTVEVFKKNFPEPEFSERGPKIYELQWKNGKFTKK